MNSASFKAAVIIAISIVASVYLGVAAATEQEVALTWIGAGLALAGLIATGRHVWAVIPVAAAFSGGLTFIPGFPQPWYAVTPVVGGFMLARFFMRSNMFVFRWTWLDTFMAIQLVALLQAYLRNPTGLALFGGDMFGGRPYFDYAVAISGYFLLSVVKTDIKVFKRVAICVIAANLFDDLIRAASNLSGGLSQVVGRFYSNVEYVTNLEGSSFVFDVDTRFAGFKDIGLTLCLICFAFRRPLSCAVPVPLWPFLCMVASTVFIFLSGFRSVLIRAGSYFVASSVVRRKPMDVVFAALAGSLCVACVGATLGLGSLPMSAQRALSFLPFEVDAQIRADAKASSDWRFEMWRIVLTSDRYIQNKLLGDGFGYSAAEHEAQMLAAQGRGVYAQAGSSIDQFIAKGSYHGWHVEAIRFTGVFGLIVGLFLLFGFARYASKAVNHYKNTPYFGYVLFICIPFLVEPFLHIFVFGSYKSTFITLISAAGIVRLLDNVRVLELAKITSDAAEDRRIPSAQSVRGDGMGVGASL